MLGIPSEHPESEVTNSRLIRRCARLGCVHESQSTCGMSTRVVVKQKKRGAALRQRLFGFNYFTYAAG